MNSGLLRTFEESLVDKLAVLLGDKHAELSGYSELNKELKTS